uniref:tyrosine--tRNA ligase n=1 Tax=Spongospora subterranea TaxID=70186 RepID=A0A0H5QG19_9EUKA|eukprot:CRZ00895.1 hypothetical protein [Spongospora subterranea]
MGDSSAMDLPDLANLTVDNRYDVVRSIGEECVQEDELRALLQSGRTDLSAYDGFEPSGRMHIAQGILKAINVNKLTKCGFTFKFWVADFFAKLNNKMGGDMEKIRVVGRYFVEIWKAAGMDMTNVEMLWTSDVINAQPEKYWTLVMDIATRFNLSRVKRCCTIMGREDSDDMLASQILYPCMQAADIFFLNVDVCQLGMDQRKVNMLARDYSSLPEIKKKVLTFSRTKFCKTLCECNVDLFWRILLA